MENSKLLNKKIKFIGIGAYRSGTTWFSQCLREHPEICIPHIKELEFFNKKYKENKYLYRNYDKGLNWYMEQFRECSVGASTWGEFSNAYLYDSEAPKLIKKTFPKIKLFLCLRNPIDRSYSSYLWFTLNFGRKKKADLDLIKFKKSKYVQRSKYSKYIRNYLRNFDRKDIHVVLYDDILKNPSKVMNDAYKFLDLKSFEPPSLSTKINVASKATNKHLTYLFDLKLKLEEINLDFIIHSLKKLGLYTFMQNFYVKINRQPISKKPLTNEQRDVLKSVFVKDILETEKLLDIDLSVWK